jgi:DNA-directed RNA polymerase subunit RPC12/RpoP
MGLYGINMGSAIRVYICSRCSRDFTDQTAWHKKTFLIDPAGQEHLFEENVVVCPLCHTTDYTLKFRGASKTNPP